MLIQSRAKKYNVSVMGYPLTRFWENEKFFIMGSVFINGHQTAKKRFLKDLKKDKRTVKIEMNDDSFGFWLVEQGAQVAIFYDPMIIFLKPGIITQKGETILEIASMDRQKLSKMALFVKNKLPGGKLVHIKNQKIRNIGIIAALPNMTDKQKKAMGLAIAHGYYGYPRKTDIGKLAGLMNVSYSTFQFHLRIAEKKLITPEYSRFLIS